MEDKIKKRKKTSEAGLFSKGGNGGPGRPAGRLNKVNADIKAMIVEALSEVGGVTYLKAQAAENPTAFLGLVGKVLPKEVHVDLTARIAAMSTEEKMTEALRMAKDLGVKL